MTWNRDGVTEHPEGGLQLLRPTVVVGVSDLRITTRRTDILATYALSSCACLTLLDAERGLGGMLHCLLPLSSAHHGSKGRPEAHFADLGAMRLLEELYREGSHPESLVATLAGGAGSAHRNHYRVGDRNVQVIKRLLARNQVSLLAEDTGGEAVRSVFLDMREGASYVRTGGRIVRLA